MTLFPSNNEKIITASIVSINIGLVTGLIIGSNITDKNILITSLATLSAAFVGAWLSYKLQDNAKKREITETKAQKANDLLFSIYQKLNGLKLFQVDSVEPWRGEEGIIGMLPILDFSLPLTVINPENINFLLGTKHEKLLFDAHIEEERFKVVENIIRFRSQLHFNRVQPAIQASGMIEGNVYTKADYKRALGEMLYKQLEKATEELIYHVDRTIKSSGELGDKIFKALKETYPNEKFAKFTLLEEMPNK